MEFHGIKSKGVLWAMNRYIFHPRGFALALIYPDDASLSDIENGYCQPTGWEMLGDGTEIWSFSQDCDEDGFKKFKGFLSELEKTALQEKIQAKEKSKNEKYKVTPGYEEGN